ncbi:Uncharacterised protein [Vibrio cholerae]|uniref:Uncharacterized protein n=1 Tax=Vibrio cholerae TaxID=666 RepID=A0A655VM07_VIBCL|nr:Uncharacterised protein [Vibrio cholerae]CSB86012.1 Uncharacterised protein [Vibrio cholerae]CSC10129.1 Uncharacterised protein [Vibrio cholerae]CSC52373.1 Uncharacterised protein [Vibrio cholerae]CSC82479.1 Uncharacterised protein [Vibrio cholerae]
MQFSARIHPIIECDVSVNRLAFDIVWNTDHGGFCNLIECHQCGFNFCRSHTVTRNVEYVIDTACDPVVTVFIATRAVTGKVHAFKGREVGLFKAVVIAIHSAHLTRP